MTRDKEIKVIEKLLHHYERSKEIYLCPLLTRRLFTEDELEFLGYVIRTELECRDLTPYIPGESVLYMEYYDWKEREKRIDYLQTLRKEYKERNDWKLQSWKDSAEFLTVIEFPWDRSVVFAKKSVPDQNMVKNTLMEYQKKWKCKYELYNRLKYGIETATPENPLYGFVLVEAKPKLKAKFRYIINYEK